MEPIGPASELDAVNEMLASIGEDPVQNVDNLPPSGNTALVLLRTQARDTQADGFWFNVEEAYSLSPNVSGEVLLADNILDIDVADSDVTARGTRLYSRTDQTYIFTAAVEARVIFHLPWDELPSVFRRFVTAIAIERFVEGFPGADPTSASRQRNLNRAQNALHRAELRNGDYSLLSNTSIQQLLRRT